MKMRLFYEDELRRKSYNEMYQIAVEEKLVDIYLENPTREELINILLKFRGARPDYNINKYTNFIFFLIFFIKIIKKL